MPGSKIFVCIPHIKTGGPESLHQFAAALRKNGCDSYVYYYNTAETNCMYECYSNLIKVAAEIEDTSQNIIIVPEIAMHLLRKYRHVKKAIWWLSVNYYQTYLLDQMYLRWKEKQKIPIPFVLYKAGKQLTRSRYNPDMKWVAAQPFYHFYNCEYAHQFAVENGVPDDHTHYLCGPIERKFIDQDSEAVIAQKEDIITYNPKKVSPELVEAVMGTEAMKHAGIRFVKIEGMNRQEVFDTLLHAKVYMDLGYFPGPERIPREAVSLYCNILTSLTGAAGNLVDVPIPRSYKFDVKHLESEKIAESVLTLMRDYRTHVAEFDTYRAKVCGQIEHFEDDVREIAAMLNL